MKKYKLSWFDNRYKTFKTEFIIAKDMHEAWQIAKLITKLFDSDSHDIEYLYEISDNAIFYTMDKIKEMYKDANKEFVLP